MEITLNCCMCTIKQHLSQNLKILLHGHSVRPDCTQNIGLFVLPKDTSITAPNVPYVDFENPQTKQLQKRRE